MTKAEIYELLPEAESTEIRKEYHKDLETAKKEPKKYLNEFPSLKNAQRYPQDFSNLNQAEIKAQIYVTILSEIYGFMTVGFQDNEKLQMSKEELLDFLNREEIKNAISDVTKDIFSYINEDPENQMGIYGDLYREFIFDNSILGQEMIRIEDTRDSIEEDTSISEYDLIY
ncbi:MAG: hypothetical protein WD512_05015 [Candidatus Paceibacterota bacterium]